MTINRNGKEIYILENTSVLRVQDIDITNREQLKQIQFRKTLLYKYCKKYGDDKIDKYREYIREFEKILNDVGLRLNDEVYDKEHITRYIFPYISYNRCRRNEFGVFDYDIDCYSVELLDFLKYHNIVTDNKV